ncbi:MAG: hypothetical protein ABEI06_08420, partial [Halobacteriaceae archaeon]
YSIPQGPEQIILLPSQSVQLIESPADPDTEISDGIYTVSPRLTVRFRGRRQLFHPPIGASYLLFPSFGIDLDDVPNPIVIDQVNGDIDLESIADTMDARLDDRPYMERILWEAFVHIAFNSQRESNLHITQFGDELLGVHQNDGKQGM